MGERDDARREIDQARGRLSAIAVELSRRMTPRYAKDQVKERARTMARRRMADARERAYEVRDRATESSWFLPLVGAGLGALAGRMLLGRAQRGGERWEGQWGGRWERDAGAGYGSHGPRDRDATYEPRGYHTREWVGQEERGWNDEESRARGLPADEGAVQAGADEGGMRRTVEAFGGEGGDRASGVGARASEAKERVAARASEVKERVSSRASEMTGRMRERVSHVRERLPDRERIRASAHDDLGLWVVGAVAAGAVLGLLVPVTAKEREVLEPARRKLRETAEDLKERALEKANQGMDEAEERLDGGGQGGAADVDAAGQDRQDSPAPTASTPGPEAGDVETGFPPASGATDPTRPLH